MYIGSTLRFQKRWAKHRLMLTRGEHHSKALQAAYAKHGTESFTYDIIEYVDDKEKLLEREQLWIDFFKPRYNGTKTAGRPWLGRQMSEETRKKMSESAKKRPQNCIWTDEMRAAKSARETGKKRNFSQDALARMRAAHIGNKRLVGIKTKGQTGRTFSDEHRLRLSIAAKKQHARNRELRGLK